MKAGKPIIGLAGGIGSGKSTVASILSDLGAAIIDSDQLNHLELDSPEVLAQLRQWWGPAVIGMNGQADRDALRKRVADDPSARRQLEQLMHPRIARRSQALLDKCQRNPNVLAIVWDAPLLFEADLAEQCDFVIFVEADESVRRERIMNRRGWTRAEFERLEKTQMPLDIKKRKADDSVVNNSDIEALRRQVQDVFSRLLAGRQPS